MKRKNLRRIDGSDLLHTRPLQRLFRDAGLHFCILCAAGNGVETGEGQKVLRVCHSGSKLLTVAGKDSMACEIPYARALSTTGASRLITNLPAH